MNHAPIELSDYQAFAETVQHYIDGAKSGRDADMKPAFHDDETIFGHAGTNMLDGPMQRLFDGVDQNPRATELQAKIATERLELDNRSGKRYTDMSTLLNAEGECKVANKFFHLHP